jgi:hypothetical protein
MEQLKIRAEKQHKDTPTKTMEGVPVGETIQIATHGRKNFIITPDMLYIDEKEKLKPLKKIETLELVLSKIQTKTLYKL